MTENELGLWIERWVSAATGEERIDRSKPLEAYGLSSRDAVVLSGELENLLGRRIDPTIAYQYPTVEALARALTQQRGRGARAALGERRQAASSPAERDVAVVGAAGRFPGAANVDEFWQLLVDGRVTTGPLPAGRWSEYAGDAYLARHSSPGRPSG